MNTKTTSPLTEICDRISRISSSKHRNLSVYRDDLFYISSLTDLITSTIPSQNQFETFIKRIYDLTILADTNIKAIVLRAIRLSLLLNHSYVDILLQDNDIVWLIITSFEKESEYLAERMQAFKILKLCIQSNPEKFPKSAARSLTAVASQKDDQLRRLSLEALRLLCLSNVSVFANANGICVLFDAILDPNISDISESLLLSILQVLSDDESRRYLCPRLDLRTLLSPLTDLDYESNTDRISIWQCSKAAFVTMMRTWTGIILLSADELGLPVLSKLLQDPKISTTVQEIIVDAFIELFKPFASMVSRPKKHRNIYNTHVSASDRFVSDVTTEHEPHDLPRSVSSAALTSRRSSIDFNTATPSRTSLTTEDIDFKSRSKSIDTSSQLSGSSSSHNSSTPIVTTSTTTTNMINQSTQHSKDGKTKGGFLSSLFTSKSQPKNKPSKTTSSSDTVPMSSPSHSFVDYDHDIRPSDIRPNVFHDVVNQPENNFEQTYNLIDSYSALLCCSVIYSKLIDSLCFLATHAELSLARKSRDLLVDILQTISTIFPEASCSDLLSMPYLIEFASIVSTNKWSSRAEKASSVLRSMTEAFSSVSIDIIQQFGKKKKDEMSISESNNQLYNIDENTPSSISVMAKPDSLKTISVKYGLVSTNTSMVNNQSPLLHSTLPQSKGMSVIDVCEEVKKSSQSRTFLYMESSSFTSSSSSSSNAFNSRSKVTLDLRLALISTIDKVDFNKQMENSRVLGKDGKEPMKWDWPLINDMLEFSFQNPERLSESLKTKFIRRLSGFYRCTNDDKAFFANLDWSVDNLLYLEAASNLYHILTEDEAGISFLSSDRRGLIFNDISHEIEQLLESTQRNQISLSPKNIFRFWSCCYTMSREYITLLGRLTATSGGRKLMEEAKVFHHLSFLANYQNMDYLARICIISLSFTDNGFLSKHFLQLWACSSSCAPEFKIFTYNLLSVLLLSRPHDFNEWGLDVLVSFLTNEESVQPILYNILHIACLDKSLLRKIISQKLQLIDDPIVKPIVTQYASIGEGIDFLRSSGSLQKELEYWKLKGLKDYVLNVERLIASAFSHISTHGKTSANGLELGSTLAIPVNMKNCYAPFSVSYRFTNPNQGDNENDSFVNQSNTIKSNIGSHVSNGSVNGNGMSSTMTPAVSSFQQQKYYHHSVDYNAAALDLEGLIRTPWNIEVKVSNSMSSQTSTDYVKVDAYLDISDLQQPMTADVISNHNRLIKVRGVVLDSKGYPSAFPIALSRSIAATLMIGINPVYRDGTVASIVEARSSRRKSTTPLPPSTINSRDTSSGRRSSATSPSVDDTDAPATSQIEYLFDWCTCKPSNRQSGNITELGDNQFSIELTGEPAKFIFTRNAPFSNSTNSVSGNQRRKTESGSSISSGASISVPDQSSNMFSPIRSASGLVYLKEVIYYLRLVSNQSLFVRMPKHFYGELSRCTEGISILKEFNIINNLIITARKESSSILERTASLWGLGHIGATEYGFSNLQHIDPAFVEYCIDNVFDSPNISLRGTFFHVLGLLGKSKKGLRKLAQLRWNCTYVNSASAVSIPRDISLLFNGDLLSMESESYESTSVISSPPQPVKCLSPFLNSGAVSLEIEVLNLVAKLPGIVPIFKESKSRLEQIRSQHPEVFSSRTLYLSIQELFSSYSFKLSVRREIVKLFSSGAKLKLASSSS